MALDTDPKPISNFSCALGAISRNRVFRPPFLLLGPVILQLLLLFLQDAFFIPLRCRVNFRGTLIETFPARTQLGGRLKLWNEGGPQRGGRALTFPARANERSACKLQSLLQLCR